MIAPDKARGMLHYAGGDGFTAPELCLTAELAAHAPAMAEQIANMHYEYAVQKPHPHDGWGFIVTNPETDEISMTPHPHWADWHNTIEEARFFAEEVDGARIVLRLASDVEVAE